MLSVLLTSFVIAADFLKRENKLRLKQQINIKKTFYIILNS